MQPRRRGTGQRNERHPLNDTTGQVSANDSGPGATSNTAIITPTAPIGPPTLSTAFGSASIPLGGSTSLTLTLTNPNAGAALISTAVSDTLPAGLVVSTPNGLSGTCVSLDSGTATADPGSATVSLSNVALPANNSCTLTVNVTGTSAGQQTNTTGAPTATYDDGSGEFTPTTGISATASVDVIAPPALILSASRRRCRAGTRRR